MLLLLPGPYRSAPYTVYAYIACFKLVRNNDEIIGLVRVNVWGRRSNILKCMKEHLDQIQFLYWRTIDNV
jgi:hypothetical protein